jgi:3-oxoacyl-[acyl-carrier protein] reductase
VWAAAVNVNLTAVATLTFAVLPRILLGSEVGRTVRFSSGVDARPASILGGNARSRGILQAGC